jgi:capsular exopolysaccharide synthesis family protein
MHDDGQGNLNPLANRNGHTRSAELVPAGLIGAASTEPGAPALSPLGLLKALRRRWPIALLLGIIAACVTFGAVWKFLPPAKQIAYARLYIPAKPEKILGEHPEGHLDFQVFQRTQMSLIRSRPVLEGVLADPRVIEAHPAFLQEEHPAEWLAQNIKVDFSEGGPELPKVFIECLDENDAKVIIDAVTSRYLEQFRSTQMEGREAKLAELKKIHKEWEKELEMIEKAITKIGLEIGVRDPQNIAIKQELKERNFHEVEAEYFRRKAELRAAQLRLRILEAHPDDSTEISKEEIDESIEADPAVVAQLKIIRDRERDLNQARKDATPEANPILDRLKKRVETEKAALPTVKESIRELVEESLKRRRAGDTRREIGKLRTHIRELEKSVVELNGEMDGLEFKAEKLNVDGMELAREKEKRDQVAKVVTRIGEKIQELSVEMKDPPRVRSLEPATIVHVADRPRRAMYSLGAALAALGAIMLGIGLLEFHSRRVDSADEVVRSLGLTVMGTLPRNSRRALAIGTDGPIQNHSSHTLFADSIDSVRTMLVHAAQSGSVRIVMVTSAVSGEGKTFLATHLAVSLARAGYKTVLIDGDLRNPIVHRVFDVASGPGLSEVLRGDAAVGDTLCPGPVPDLWVMPAGRMDLAAIRALVRDRLRTVLDGLRSQFDCILIDSSPILRVSDSLSIAKCVDGVLFAVMRNVSRLPRVQAAYSKLDMLGVRVLGAVVNGTTSDEQSYGAGYEPHDGAAVVG